MDASRYAHLNLHINAIIAVLGCSSDPKATAVELKMAKAAGLMAASVWPTYQWKLTPLGHRVAKAAKA